MELRLDTHVVVWLYAGHIELLSEFAIDSIDESDALLVSPMVELELAFLHEIGRLGVSASEVLNDLSRRIDLTRSDRQLSEIVGVATTLDWTRDPFDRLIVADAMAAASPLLTRDRVIRANFDAAVW